jgi:hypothetical protein
MSGQLLRHINTGKPAPDNNNLFHESFYFAKGESLGRNTELRYFKNAQNFLKPFLFLVACFLLYWGNIGREKSGKWRKSG